MISEKNRGIYVGLAGSLLLICLALYHAGQPATQQAPQDNKQLEILTVSSVQEIWDYYDSIGYTFEELRNGSVKVPRIYLERIVNTWAKDQSLSSKKSLFYRTMLPLVLMVNEKIMEEREYLLELKKKRELKRYLAKDEHQWLNHLARRYRIIKKDEKFKTCGLYFNKLLLRVDEIPVSMALGQMAYESAYATSRFAGEGNALFGQWRWGDGMMPSEQRDGKGDYRVADFAFPIDSMKAYAMNMNTNPAYKKFRKARTAQRSKGLETLDGFRLALTLERYSERRQEYVKTLQGIIATNSLSQLDDATLMPGRPIILVPQLTDS